MAKEITLCLSGGGFRATIFHLGVIDYLSQAGQLSNVRSVYGVSGGAITAAHLAHNWASYLDPNLFTTAAVPLLQHCHEGMVDRIVWSNLLWQTKRSNSLSGYMRSLFSNPIHSQAKPTFLVCSSLSDLSQFAVEIGSKRLFHLRSPEHSEPMIRDVGQTSIETSQAVAMSACFPIAFEPITLDPQSIGLDRQIFGPNHKVADGGIVDNTAIWFACAKETITSNNHAFLISDAGKIFDDLGPEQEKIATAMSPFRTIDYLMDKNAELRLEKLRSRLKDRDQIASIRLIDARKLVDEKGVKINADLLYSALRIRTNFDSFAVPEILTLYRLGLMLGQRVCESELGAPTATVDPDGLIGTARLDHDPLNAVWQSITIKTRSSGFEELIEFLLLRPGFLIVSISFILFFALAAIGFAVTALLRGL